MNQTEYLVSCGAPPLPKGWVYEVKYLPEYDTDRDQWFTIVDAKIWDTGNTTVISHRSSRVSTQYFEKLGHLQTLNTVKSTQPSSINRTGEIKPTRLTSLRTKEDNA